jgi:hypothetical protein
MGYLNKDSIEIFVEFTVHLREFLEVPIGFIDWGQYTIDIIHRFVHVRLNGS